jgi:outer membrane receptor protein involved in Fe transport
LSPNPAATSSAVPLFFYYDHESLQSTNTTGTDLEPEPGETPEQTGRKFQYEPGLTIGGPIIKDKLWFFGNLSMSSREQYAPGYPWDKAPGEGDTPMDQKEFFPYLKLTFQPSPSDKFIISYNYSDRRLNHRFADRYQSIDTTVKQKTPTHVFNAHWTKTFGSNFYANLKLAFVKFNMNLDSKRPGSWYSDWLTSHNYGTYWRNEDHNKRNRYQVVVDATTFIDDFAGSHELKFGGELQMAKTGWKITTNPDDPTGLALIYSYPEAMGGNGIYYGYHIESFDRKEDMLNYSVFLNDTWSVSNNLTLSLGLRYDHNSVIWPVQGGDSVYNPFLDEIIDRSITSKMTPQKWDNFSPRLGLIYDIFADGSTLLKASWAHYVQPNQVGFVNLAHPNGWLYWREGYFGSDTVQAYYSGTTPGGTLVGYPGHDLIAPTSNELTVGVEREMWEDWSLGIRYIKKWDKDLLHVVDANALDMDALLDNGDLIWTDWEAVEAYDPYSGQNVTFYNDLNPSRLPADYIVNPPGAEREYDGIELTLNKRYSHGWSINASYVYSNSRGLISTARGGQSLGTSNLWDDPNAHVNAIGRFPRERRHQIKITGLVKGPWGINIGGYFRSLAGRRYTRTVSSDFLGLELNQTAVSNNADERGTSGYPTQNQLDLKVEKAFKIGNVELKLFADIFNVFNDNTVISAYTNSSNPSRIYGEDLDIIDPRVVRFGAKIEF